MTVQVGFLFYLNANFLRMNQDYRSGRKGAWSFDYPPTRRRDRRAGTLKNKFENFA